MASGREIVSFFDDDDEEIATKKHRMERPFVQFGGEKKPKPDPCEFCDKYKNGGQLHLVRIAGYYFFYILLFYFLYIKLFVYSITAVN